ncbi:MAG: hypothetical protein IPJ65_11280 [Archangiaceae bacterium]|nr:hypothetical protein [Archangiaceae bacterium]
MKVRALFVCLVFAAACSNAPANTCTSDAQCLNGTHCGAKGSCEADCATDRDCLNGTHCAAGRCLENPSDAGQGDGGVSDAGSGDAGSTDAGSTDAGLSDAGSSDGGVDAGYVDAGVECAAQRTVYIAAGNGTLAWFTTVWPGPKVITNYVSTYAYDDPSRAVLVLDGGHPLYTRKLPDGGTLWGWSDGGVEPSVLVQGQSAAHSAAVQITVNGRNFAAYAASLQRPLGAPVPVLRWAAPETYAAKLDAGEPDALAVPGGAVADQTVAALRTVATISVATEAELKPSAAQLAAWTGPSPAVAETDFATRLWMTAQLFRLGLVSTVVLPGTIADPHSAWADVPATTRSIDTLARILDGFYAELAKHPEPACTHGGAPLRLDHNTVLVVTGDTWKNSFNNVGWSDGTPAGVNLMYVRSNGWLKPGWSGDISPSTMSAYFDPATGATVPNGNPAQTNAASLLGVIYAVSRGDLSATTALSSQDFTGLRRSP